jgi:DNA-binding response OmpR family regulator
MNAFPFDQSYCDSDYWQPTPRYVPSALSIADPPTLLVVDDDPCFRELETQALCNQGYKVLQADGPSEALRLAGVTPVIDLLLTDFVMPEFNGLELARQFRTLHPQVPVLMVSNSLALIKHKVNSLDRFSVLEKSSSFDELIGKVHALLTKVSPLPLRTN